MARKLAPQRMISHRVERSRSKLAHVGSGDSALQGHRYTGLFAIQTMVLSSFLQSSHDLELVIAQAIRVACPEQLAEELLRLVRNLPVPGAATLSRWRFRVDVSFMLQQRATFGELLRRDSMFFYILCDASPQAGREWFMTEVP